MEMDGCIPHRSVLEDDNALRRDVMKNVRVVGMVLLFVIVADLVFGTIAYGICEKKRNDYAEDCENLRSIIAEAYVNTVLNPDFENTATDDQPIEIPEKYYTSVESAQGDGWARAVLYADGNVDVYFGSPEKTLDYYRYGEGYEKIKRPNLWFSFTFTVLYRLPIRHIVPFVSFCAVVALVIVVCWSVRHRKKAFEETIDEIQSDSKPDEVS